jgi:hypothetical protein
VRAGLRAGDILLGCLPPDVELVTLAPLAPLGTHSAPGTVSLLISGFGVNRLAALLDGGKPRAKPPANAPPPRHSVGMSRKPPPVADKI